MERLCLCGCGEPVLPNREFAGRGHNRRVSTGAIRQLPLCACGCGERVKKLGGAYRQGHAKKVLLNLHTETPCRACGKSIPHPPNQPRIYCDRICQADAQRKERQPITALGYFLSERWKASALSLSAYAESIGLTRAGLTYLLDGRAPTRPTVATLRAHFGTDLPPFEAAGRKQREMANDPRWYRRLHTKKARQKGAAARRGVPHTEERRRRVRDALEASGALARLADFQRRWARSPEGKSILTVRSYLHWHPTPSDDDLTRLAIRTANRVGITVREVQRYWRPILIRRGLKHAGGRPSRHQHRERIFTELLAEWPPIPSGRLSNGWMEEYVDRIALAEPDTEPSYVMLRRWLYREGLLPLDSTIKCDVTANLTAG